MYSTYLIFKPDGDEAVKGLALGDALWRQGNGCRGSDSQACPGQKASDCRPQHGVLWSLRPRADVEVGKEIRANFELSRRGHVQNGIVLFVSDQRPYKPKAGLNRYLTVARWHTKARQTPRSDRNTECRNVMHLLACPTDSPGLLDSNTATDRDLLDVDHVHTFLFFDNLRPEVIPWSFVPQK
jgi:hypothetical protein